MTLDAWPLPWCRARTRLAQPAAVFAGSGALLEPAKKFLERIALSNVGCATSATSKLPPAAGALWSDPRISLSQKDKTIRIQPIGQPREPRKLPGPLARLRCRLLGRRVASASQAKRTVVESGPKPALFSSLLFAAGLTLARWLRKPTARHFQPQHEAKRCASFAARRRSTHFENAQLRICAIAFSS